MRYGDLIQQLDEAFSPADLGRIERWVTQAFATRGIELDFSPHFKIRADQRSEKLTAEEICKVFAIMLLNDSARVAFEKLSNKSNIFQRGRVLDFKLNGNVGSVQLNKLGKNKYQAETLYYGETLSQGARGRIDIDKMMRAQPGRPYKTPVENIGEIPNVPLINIIKQTREHNLSGKDVNIYGYNQSKPLPHQQSDTVFQLTASTVTMTVDNLRKLILDQASPTKNVEQSEIIMATNNMAETVKALTQMNILNMNQDQDASRGYNILLSLAKQSKQQLQQHENIHLMLGKSAGNITQAVEKQASIDEKTFNEAKAVMRPYIYMLSQNKDADRMSDAEYKSLLADPSITNNKSISVSNFLKNKPTITNRIAKTAATTINNLTAKYTGFVQNTNAITNTLSGGERKTTDELGATTNLTPNIYTGNISNSSADRAQALRQNRADYDSNLWALSGTKAIDVVDTRLQQLLSTKRSNDPSETEIREYATAALQAQAAGNTQEFIDYVELLTQSTVSRNTTFNTKFATLKKQLAQILPQMKQQLIQGSTMKEDLESNQLNQAELSKYVNLLLTNASNPVQVDDWSTYDPDVASADDVSTQIPQEYRLAAKSQAFKILINHVKNDPDFMDTIEHGYIPWIPLSIYDKLRNTVEELDALHQQLVADEHKKKMLRHANIK